MRVVPNGSNVRFMGYAEFDEVTECHETNIFRESESLNIRIVRTDAGSVIDTPEEVEDAISGRFRDSRRKLEPLLTPMGLQPIMIMVNCAGNPKYPVRIFPV